jgi:hypothetical protein
MRRVLQPDKADEVIESETHATGMAACKNTTIYKTLIISRVELNTDLSIKDDTLLVQIEVWHQTMSLPNNRLGIV